MKNDANLGYAIEVLKRELGVRLNNKVFLEGLNLEEEKAKESERIQSLNDALIVLKYQIQEGELSRDEMSLMQEVLIEGKTSA